MKLRALLFLLMISSVGCLDKCSENNLLTGPSSISSRSGPELWIAPNIGSGDFASRMFTNLEEWTSARASISTFQFYEQNVSPGGCGICGPNTIDKFLEVDAFRKLRDERKLISLEAGALKHGGHGCESSVPNLGGNAISAIQNVSSGGGTVSYLGMDWPFGSGTICGFSTDKSAKLIGEFIRIVNNVYPGVRIGLIGGYPTDTPKRMTEQIEALEANGIHLPFVHYDYDRYGTQRAGPDFDNRGGYNVREDLPKIRDYLRSRNITFGVVVWGEDGDSSEGFSADGVLSIQQVRDALGGDVDRLIFQSWEPFKPGYGGENINEDRRYFPNNLPETKPGTLTWFVNTEGKRFR